MCSRLRINDGDGNVLMSKECVSRRWKEYFDGLTNEENESELATWLSGVQLSMSRSVLLRPKVAMCLGLLL